MNSQSKRLSYTQASRSNVNKIIKIKDAFLNLSSNKVSEIHKVINNSSQKVKPKINMIINRLLKRVKSGISVDFICSNNKRLLITTIKVAAISDLNIIEKYIKELNDIDLNDIMSLRLSQSKS